MSACSRPFDVEHALSPPHVNIPVPSAGQRLDIQNLLLKPVLTALQAQQVTHWISVTFLKFCCCTYQALPTRLGVEANRQVILRCTGVSAPEPSTLPSHVAGPIVTAHINFNGAASSSDCITKEDLRLTGSQAMALRLLARGGCSMPVSRLRALLNISSIIIPPELLTITGVLQLIRQCHAAGALSGHPPCYLCPAQAGSLSSQQSASGHKMSSRLRPSFEQSS